MTAFRSPAAPASQRGVRLFSTEPASWARWEMLVSRNYFCAHEPYGFARWFWVAWLLGHWIVWRRPLTSVEIRHRAA